MGSSLHTLLVVFTHFLPRQTSSSNPRNIGIVPYNSFDALANSGNVALLGIDNVLV